MNVYYFWYHYDMTYIVTLKFAYEVSGIGLRQLHDHIYIYIYIWPLFMNVYYFWYHYDMTFIL